MLQGIVLAGCKSIIGYIFTSDEWVSDQHRHIHHLPSKGNSICDAFLLLLAATLWRLSRTTSQSTHFYSSLTHFWYVKTNVLVLFYIKPSCLTAHRAVCWFCWMNVFVFFFLFISILMCFQCVCSGILVGSGMQKIAALSNLVCYYFIGLPVGIALMFAAELRILGNAFIPILLCIFLHVNENRSPVPVI